MQAAGRSECKCEYNTISFFSASASVLCFFFVASASLGPPNTLYVPAQTLIPRRNRSEKEMLIAVALSLIHLMMAMMRVGGGGVLGPWLLASPLGVTGAGKRWGS